MEIHQGGLWRVYPVARRHDVALHNLDPIPMARILRTVDFATLMEPPTSRVVESDLHLAVAEIGVTQTEAERVERFLVQVAIRPPLHRIIVEGGKIGRTHRNQSLASCRRVTGVQKRMSATARPAFATRVPNVKKSVGKFMYTSGAAMACSTRHNDDQLLGVLPKFDEKFKLHLRKLE